MTVLSLIIRVFEPVCRITKMINSYLSNNITISGNIGKEDKQTNGISFSAETTWPGITNNVGLNASEC